MLLKKVIIAVFTFFLFSSSVFAKEFSDVSVTNAHYKAIQNIYALGVMQGYADDTFRPEQLINRAEFVKTIAEFLHRKDKETIEMCSSNGLGFADVKDAEWYGHHLCRAKDDHLIGGYPDNTFRPDNNIIFVEAAKVVSILETRPIFDQLHTSVTADGKPANVKRMSASIRTGPWYKAYVDFLAYYKSIPLDITAFDQPLSRGQIAEILYRIEHDNSDRISQTYDTIGKASWFTEENVCTDPPTRGTPELPAQTIIYPVKEEYARIGYLGQLLTASECGKNRLKEMLGNTNAIPLTFAYIYLNSAPSTELQTYLKQTNFSCRNSAIQCTEWLTEKTSLDQFLGLKPFVKQIGGFDCSNCFLHQNLP